MARLILALVLTLASGCAWTSVKPVDHADRSEPGLRIYDPKPLLVVTSENASIIYVPDFERAYRVEFGAVLAKTNVTLKTSQGSLTELESQLDATGFLTLVQNLGQTALEQLPKLKALGADVSGTIPDRVGVYEFVYDKGRFAGFRRLELPGPAAR